MIRYLRIVFFSFILCFLFTFTTKAEVSGKWWENWGSKGGDTFFIYNGREYIVRSSEPCFLYYNDTRGIYYAFTSVPSDFSIVRYNPATDSDTSISFASAYASSYLVSEEAKGLVSDCYVYSANIDPRGEALFYDFMGSYEDFEAWLLDTKGEAPEPPTEPTNTLPVLTYTAKKHVYTTTSIPVMRWNTYISWDYKEKEPYASNSNGYSYELKYSLITEDGSTYGSIDYSNLKFLDSGALSKNVSSFSNYDLNKKLESLGETRQKCAVLIRTRMNNSDLCSNWTIFYLYQLNASPTYMDGGTATPDGSTDIPPGRPDYYDPTDGIDDSDTPTSAGTNKDSDIYNTNSSKLNTSDAISSLKTAVSSLSEVISLFGTVYSWLPGWLITMISVSIALLVIVGLVKLIIS